MNGNEMPSESSDKGRLDFTDIFFFVLDSDGGVLMPYSDSIWEIPNRLYLCGCSLKYVFEKLLVCFTFSISRNETKTLSPFVRIYFMDVKVCKCKLHFIVCLFRYLLFIMCNINYRVKIKHFKIKFLLFYK